MHCQCKPCHSPEQQRAALRQRGHLLYWPLMWGKQLARHCLAHGDRQTDRVLGGQVALHQCLHMHTRQQPLQVRLQAQDVFAQVGCTRMPVISTSVACTGPQWKVSANIALWHRGISSHFLCWSAEETHESAVRLPQTTMSTIHGQIHKRLNIGITRTPVAAVWSWLNRT